jgi:ubiquinone/menaquinone biosynthesis C-methylase UbiE
MIPDRDPEQNEIRALHRLVNFDDQRVIEIGCGNGRLTWRYARTARQVVAIDTDLASLQAGDEAKFADGNRSAFTQLTFMQAQAEALPFSAERFDLAILAWSL